MGDLIPITPEARVSYAVLKDSHSRAVAVIEAHKREIGKLSRELALAHMKIDELEAKRG